MFEMKTCDVGSAKLAYYVFGSGEKRVVIETALGTCSAEWWHIAQELSSEYTVLVYDRAGYGKSSTSKMLRTPKNISFELAKLLQKLKIDDNLILIGHSQGGLYCQQFVRDYPDKVKALILIDPLAATDNRFREVLSEKEFKQSGVDKTKGIRLGAFLSRLGLAFLFKPILLKAPPFYYFDGFTNQAKDYLLSSMTKSHHYKTALEEYLISHKETEISHLKEKDNFPDIPLVLITHNSNKVIEEIITFGGMDKKGATKVEGIWQDLMREYLTFSGKAKFIQAEKSSHFIHLTEPGLINKAIKEANF